MIKIKDLVFKGEKILSLDRNKTILGRYKLTHRVFTKGSNTFLHHPKEDIIAPRTNHRMFPSNFGKLNHTWNYARDLLRICTLSPCQKWSQVKNHNYIFLSGKSSLNSHSDILLVTTAAYKLWTKHGHFEFENSRPQGDLVISK